MTASSSPTSGMSNMRGSFLNHGHFFLHKMQMTAHTTIVNRGSKMTKGRIRARFRDDESSIAIFDETTSALVE